MPETRNRRVRGAAAFERQVSKSMFDSGATIVMSSPTLSRSLWASSLPMMMLGGWSTSGTAARLVELQGRVDALALDHVLLEVEDLGDQGRVDALDHHPGDPAAAGGRQHSREVEGLDGDHVGIDGPGGRHDVAILGEVLGVLHHDHVGVDAQDLALELILEPRGDRQHHGQGRDA
jgi:hypothetical protein